MPENDLDSLVVMLCLICHWSFPEACKFIKETPIKKLRAFVSELQYQKSVEDYRIASYSAMIICTWANAQSKNSHHRITDFIGQPPQRADAKSKLAKAIEKANIKLPTGGIK